MSSTLTAPIEIIDDGSGNEGHGYLYTCTCSNSDVFYIFQFPETGHPHFQCAQCEQTYCLFGCAIPPRVEDST